MRFLSLSSVVPVRVGYDSFDHRDDASGGPDNSTYASAHSCHGEFRSGRLGGKGRVQPRQFIFLNSDASLSAGVTNSCLMLL